jgi:hypothetical protein
MTAGTPIQMGAHDMLAPICFTGILPADSCSAGETTRLLDYVEF